jgi:hypothetical protein
LGVQDERFPLRVSKWSNPITVDLRFGGYLDDMVGLSPMLGEIRARLNADCSAANV